MIEEMKLEGLNVACRISFAFAFKIPFPLLIN